MSKRPPDPEWVSSIFLIPVRSPNGFQTWEALDPEWWRPWQKQRPVFRPVEQPKVAGRVAGRFPER